MKATRRRFLIGHAVVGSSAAGGRLYSRIQTQRSSGLASLLKGIGDVTANSAFALSCPKSGSAELSIADWESLRTDFGSVFGDLSEACRKYPYLSPLADRVHITASEQGRANAQTDQPMDLEIRGPNATITAIVVEYDEPVTDEEHESETATVGDERERQRPDA